MTTYAFLDFSSNLDACAFASKALRGSQPFSYILLAAKASSWDFFYVKANGEIKHHRIKRYYLGNLSIYKNGGHFLSKTLEGLLSYLVGRPLSLCTKQYG